MRCMKSTTCATMKLTFKDSPMRKHRHARHRPLATPPPAPPAQSAGRQRALLLIFWGYVLLPLAWGVSATVQKALLLFK